MKDALMALMEYRDFWRETAQEMREILNEAKEAQWRPISTAPKDETEVIVYCEYASQPFVHIAFYRHIDEDMISLDWDECDEGWWSYVENSVSQHHLNDHKEPTHWMPLPPTPVTE